MYTLILQSALNRPETLNAADAMRLADARPGKVRPRTTPRKPRLPQRILNTCPALQPKPRPALKHLRSHNCQQAARTDKQYSIGYFENLLENSPNLCCPYCELHYKRITHQERKGA